MDTETRRCPKCDAAVSPGRIACALCGCVLDTEAAAPEEAPREKLPLREQIVLKQACMALVVQSVSEQNRSLDRVLFGAEFLYQWLIGEKKAADLPAYVPPRENGL